MSRRFSAPATQRGFAIVLALITIVVLSSVILTAVTQFRAHSHQVERRGEDYQVESAVESASDLAMHALWSDYRGRVLAGTLADSVLGFRAYLDSIGCTDQSDAATPATFDLGPRLGLDSDADGTVELSSIRVESVVATRVDLEDATELRVVTTAGSRVRRIDDQAGGWLRSIETTFVLEPDTWGGLEYVLLANNVNCALCHMKVDTTERAYRIGPGPYARVKVGTLEQLLMRTWADSDVYGTLHAAGPVTDEFGAPITDWDDFSLRAAELDADGHIVEDSSGDPITADIVPADGSADEFGALYEDYSATEMVDGELPNLFPPPFPDDGGIDPATGNRTTAGENNRRVDPNEFHAATRRFRGSLSGGRIHVVSPSGVIDSSSDLTVAMDTSSTTYLDSVTEGQVFLTGTADEPILLNGDIAIDGNLVIRGWIKGKGAIWVSENVYAPVDVRYVDGTDGSGDRTFGRAGDGTENLLVVTAGGNVMIGDPFQPYRVNTSLEGKKPSFAYMEMSIFNRGEWVRTQPTLPGASGTFTNPLYDPNHVPRYYAMQTGEPIGIFNKGGGYFDAAGTWRGDEHPDDWDSSLITFGDPSDTADPLLYDASGNPKAHVSVMKATDGWITNAQLANLMDEAWDGRPTGQLEIDMFAYTNNAIFGIVSTMGRNAGGRLRINGGVVAADVGLLATNGIQLNYDGRVHDLLRIQGEERVVVRRGDSRILR